MKIAGIIIGVIMLLALGFQGWVMYISETEEQPYQVIARFDQIEIRHYPPARMASVDNANASANGSFQVLAGYIFGGNSEQQEIAMTAPVHMEKTDAGSRMSFVLPQEVWDTKLPVPNDDAVQLHWSEAQDVAAVQFSGFSNADLQMQYRALLIRTLDSLGIQHQNDFRSLGYDPPFKMNDRRNEIIVSIDRSTLPE